MVEIRVKTIKEAFPLILNRILTFGERVDVKIDGKMVETLEYPEPIITRIKNPLTDMIPEWSLWPSKIVLDEYANDVINNKKTSFDYTYGERLRAFEVIEEDNEGYPGDIDFVYYDQLEYIIDKLARDRTSRSAIASLWKINTDVMGGNPPCCLIVDASIRKDKLNLTVYIRSNDMFSAWPENGYLFSMISKYICEQINSLYRSEPNLYRFRESIVLPGTLTIISSKAHIYWYDIEKACKVVEKEDLAITLLSSFGKYKSLEGIA